MLVLWEYPRCKSLYQYGDVDNNDYKDGYKIMAVKVNNNSK
jgi:hypothetical protein